MKRIVITLILSIFVFVVTILVSVTHVNRVGLQTADYINNHELDNFQDEQNYGILLTENTARSFLAGIPSVYIGSDSTSLIIEPSELPAFKRIINEALTQFMKVNGTYENSMFVIDSAICRKYFPYGGINYPKHWQRGFAPSISRGETTFYDVSEDFDFMGSAVYQQLKRDRKILWTTPDLTTPVTGRLITLNMPMTMRNGQFFGVFSLSIDVKTIEDVLKAYLPYGEKHSAMFIVDSTNNIFAFYPEWIMELDCQEIIRTTSDRLNRHDKDKEHNIIFFEGEKYYVYQRDELLLPWRIFTVSHSDAIYGEERKLVRVIVLCSVIGMLLMLVCCNVIFRQIRKKLREKAAVEEELRMAATVQNSMLKPSVFAMPPISLQAFMRPATETGGDLYDYMEKDGKLIFCIGDVSGKGMAAALFMTQVVSLFRNAVRYTSEPSQIVGQINSVLVTNNPNMTFCTFFVGVYDGEMISFCNAGHNPPVLIPAAAGPSFMKVRPNLAIGLMDGFPYQTETIPFSSGDKLVLYTDGVTEAWDKDHNQFGEERLLNVLQTLPQCETGESGQLINTTVLQSVERFVQQAEQSDDITIVSIVNFGSTGTVNSSYSYKRALGRSVRCVLQ